MNLDLLLFFFFEIQSNFCCYFINYQWIIIILEQKVHILHT